MPNNGRNPMTINDLRKEVEAWRKQKPVNESVLLFLKSPVDRAGALIFFVILVLTLVFVPVFELIRLVILRPIFSLFHTIVVLIAAIFLRITARPLIRLGIKAIKNKEQKRFSRFFYTHFPGFLRFFVRCFGPSLKFYLKIDTKDVRSIGKFQEWVDDTLGVEGIWVESDVNRAVRRETWCPFAGREIPYVSGAGQESRVSNPGESLKSDGTEFCSYFMAGWLNDFVRYCNPEFEIAPVNRMIPKGDEFCEFIWRRKNAW